MTAYEEMTLRQGSQPRLRGVRVGIHRVGEPQGVATARLLLRLDEQRRKVDLTGENPVDLFGRGTLELVAVHRPAEGELSASVTVRISD